MGSYGGITNPPVFIGRTFFYGGFQIRRDALRKTFLWTPCGRLFSGRLAEDFSGRLAEDFASIPLGVSTDLQSVVKKCPNLFCVLGICNPQQSVMHFIPQPYTFTIHIHHTHSPFTFTIHIHHSHSPFIFSIPPHTFPSTKKKGLKSHF